MIRRMLTFTISIDDRTLFQRLACSRNIFSYNPIALILQKTRVPVFLAEMKFWELLKWELVKI